MPLGSLPDFARWCIEDNLFFKLISLGAPQGAPQDFRRTPQDVQIVFAGIPSDFLCMFQGCPQGMSSYIPKDVIAVTNECPKDALVLPQ